MPYLKKYRYYFAASLTSNGSAYGGEGFALSQRTNQLPELTLVVLG